MLATAKMKPYLHYHEWNNQLTFLHNKKRYLKEAWYKEVTRTVRDDKQFPATIEEFQILQKIYDEIFSEIDEEIADIESLLSAKS